MASFAGYHLRVIIMWPSTDQSATRSAHCGDPITARKCQPIKEHDSGTWAGKKYNVWVMDKKKENILYHAYINWYTMSWYIKKMSASLFNSDAIMASTLSSTSSAAKSKMSQQRSSLRSSSQTFRTVVIGLAHFRLLGFRPQRMGTRCVCHSKLNRSSQICLVNRQKGANELQRNLKAS